MKRLALVAALAFVLGARTTAAQTAAPTPAPAARPASVNGLLQQARQQSSRKDTAAALATLRQALAVAPNSEDVLSAYSQVALAARAPTPAVLALEPLTRMHPTVAQYRYLLGVALMQAGDLPAATPPLVEAERLEPNRVLTLVALGLALNGRKLYGEARPRLERALELEPDNVEALAALAEAEEGTGDLASAEAHARRVLGRVESHPIANLVVGMVLMKQERYADARDALAKAVAADPDSAKAHYQLSLACARLGDDAGAAQHLDTYRRVLQQVEDRIKRLRAETGMEPTGMGR